MLFADLKSLKALAEHRLKYKAEMNLGQMGQGFANCEFVAWI